MYNYSQHLALDREIVLTAGVGVHVQGVLYPATTGWRTVYTESMKSAYISESDTSLLFVYVHLCTGEWLGCYSTCCSLYIIHDFSLY